MKYLEIKKDGSVIARLDGYDICHNDIPRLLHKKAPCEINFFDGDKLEKVIRVKKTKGGDQ